MLEIALWIVVGVGLGFLLGWWIRLLIGRRVLAEAQTRGERILKESRREGEKSAKMAVLQAKDDWFRTRNRMEREIRNRQRNLQDLQRNLREGENKIRNELDSLKRQEKSLRERERTLNDGARQIKEQVAKVGIQRADYLERLEKVSGFTVEEAKRSLLNILRNETRHEAAVMIKEVKEEAQRNADREARKLSHWPSTGWPRSTPPRRR